MKNKSNMIFAMILALIVIAAIAAMVIFNQKNSSDEETANTETGEIDVTGQPMLGDESAPVTLVEFGDFMCPACKYYDMEIQPELIKKYVDKGDVKMYFINTPFHGEGSLIGAHAAEYVWKNEPTKYWAFHNALFEAQPATHEEGNNWLTKDVVKKAAEKVGVSDADQVTAAKEDTAVNKDIELYKKHNVTQTPTIVVDGKVVNDQLNIESLEKAIEAAKK
ncbi:disulfide bond formation protein D [Macrococcus hajekii]|nr:DsbA family protein [Macrococcus hajekii]GGB09573.1 disulfide bond formation protein D [Macrococcus hajekii]